MTFSLPGYIIGETIHESSNAIVYRGQRTRDGHAVILKTLPTPSPTAAEIARYQQEYDLTRKLNEARVADIAVMDDLLQFPDQVVLVLEDSGAQSLGKYLQKKPLPLADFFPIAIKIARIVGQIHQQHVIHKDINPANILFNPETRQVQLIDFGLATQLSHEMVGLANANTLEGTLPYLAPEQTGRMNRKIDYRADFYAMGATFYQMLVGWPPFEAQSADLLSLINAHLTEKPVPPHEYQPQIPEMVSQIVLKLLAKDAAERYQSAYGLQVDLVECWSQWEASQHILAFPLAQSDVSDLFRLPQNLYGRAAATQQLWDAFAQVSAGNVEMLLVTGEAGVGKTAVVQELYRPLTQRRGFFMTGGFGQLQRQTPYYPLVQGLRDLIRQLLSESAEQIAIWRTKFQQALGRNAQVMINLIPELHFILGDQPPAPELPPEERRNRFNLLFQALLTLFAQPQHPLVIFLDDMQWSDLASLELIEKLLNSHAIRHLLIIGAYRTAEVTETHPLQQLLGRLAEAGQATPTIHLAPLDTADVTQYVSEALHRPATHVRTLAQLVHTKTAGNPFFMGEFLKQLHTQTLIRFDHGRGQWVWNLAEIEAQGITDNVATLMAATVRQLPPETQQLLTMAACIGSQFDLYLLAQLIQRDIPETANLLWPALMAELIIPLDETYRLVRLVNKTDLNVRFYFTHDRVQEAAYQLLSNDERTHIHGQVGQSLWQQYEQAPEQTSLFMVVNQLNLGHSPTAEPAQRLELAKLNGQAAAKAKGAAAYQAAYEYARQGIAILPATSWTTDYPLTLGLYVEGVRMAYLSNALEQMAVWHTAALGHTADILDQLPLHDQQIQVLFSQQKLAEALRLGLDVLAQLGITIAEDVSAEALQEAHTAVEQLWQAEDIPTYLHLPPLTDARLRGAMQLLIRLQQIASVIAPRVQVSIILNMVHISLRHGNSAGSCLAYITYANLLILQRGQVAEGYQFGLLALNVLQKFEAREFEARVQYVFNGFVRFWQEPLQQSLDSLLANYHNGRETGDFFYGYVSILLHTVHALGMGHELESLHEKLLVYQREAQRYSLYVNDVFPVYVQGLRCLLGQTAGPTMLDGEGFDEAQVLEKLAQRNNGLSRAVIFMFKLVAAYGQGDYELAHQFTAEIAPYKHLFWGTYWYVLFNFYDSLAHLAILDTTHTAEETDKISAYVAANQAQLAEWGGRIPHNFLPQWHLVEAERTWRLGPNGQARTHYDQAIELAQEYGNRHVEAIALEKAAEYHLRRGQIRLASYYMSDAHYVYGRWQMRGKLLSLQKRYPQLILQRGRESGYGTIRTSLASTSSHNVVSSAIDLKALTQATQNIAGEVVGENLHQQLMVVMLENSAAHRGLLLLPENSGWHIGVESSKTAAGVINRHTLPLIPASAPLLITNYVIRTQQTLVLNNVLHDDPRLANDPYILHHHTRAAVCLPLLNRGELRGVLYLENTFTTDSFTDNHLGLLHILASQAAVALDNARLYQDLEYLVDKRTAELKNLISELDAFSHTVAHDLKSPLSGIIGYAEMLTQDGLPPSSAELLGRILQSGQRMRGIIDGLLTLATTRANEVQVSPLDTTHIIQELHERFAYALQQSDAELTYPTDWPVVMGYEAWVIEVWANYISNAIKYGGQPPRIALGFTREENHMIRFWVKDNGRGLSPAAAAQLFVPFSRVGESRSDSHGLGLSIAQRIIERLNGRVGVESAAGTGSTFYFTLPLATP